MRFEGMPLAAILLGLVAGVSPLHAQDPARPPVQPLCSTACGGGALTVTAVPGAVVRLPSVGGLVVKFVVANGLDYGIETTAIACLRSGTVAGCTGVTPASLSLGVGAQDTVRVTYATGAATGAGTVSLRVSFDGAGSPVTGVQSVTVASPGSPGVARRYDPGDIVERSACLTLAAGLGAWQCGDLLLAHAMPAYRSLGRDRALTLLYSSAVAAARPVVAAVVTMKAGVPPPDSVYAELRVGSLGQTQTVRASATYGAWSDPWGSGTQAVARQIALSYDPYAGAPATTDLTGVYGYTLLVRNKYATAVRDDSITGRMVVLDRRLSRFGRGWALAGVERLQPGIVGGYLAWYGGDGSTRLYLPAGTNRWIAPAAAFRDTIALVGSGYERRLRHGVVVRFDGSGRQVEVVNRVGQRTRYFWSLSSDRLDSLQVPPEGGSAYRYRFAYDVNGALASITDPAGRLLQLTVTNGLLTAITDPDGVGTGIGYDAGGRVTSATNRMGVTTRFVYANGLRLTGVHEPYGLSGGSDTARTGFASWDEAGLSTGTGATGRNAADTALAYTTYYGPRGPSDSTLFWVDRWGAPTRITNALGVTTTIRRQSNVYPLLVTQLIEPLGRSYTMLYDTTIGRANLLVVRDSVPGGTPLTTRVSTWVYPTNGPNPDSPASVTDAAGLTTTYSYNGMGLLEQALDARGLRTSLGYDSTTGPLRGVLLTSTEHDVPTWVEQAGAVDDTLVQDAPVRNLVTRYGYDAQGNVDSVANPAGIVTAYQNDAAGRTTTAWDALGMKTRITFDALNRPLSATRWTSPQATPYGGLPAMTCDATQVLCADSMSAPLSPGTADSVVVTYWQGVVGLDSLRGPLGAKRRYGYDRRGDLVEERDGRNRAERSERDASGAVIMRTLRTGNAVRMRYDLVGRLISRAYSPIANYSQSYNVLTMTGPVTIPGDSVNFVYDALGRPLNVTSTAGGSVVRTYDGRGNVLTRILSRVTPADSLRLSWDVAGRRTALVHNRDSVAYFYGAVTGDLDSTVVQWAGLGLPSRRITFSWDVLGRRSQLTLPATTAAPHRLTYRYDANGLLRRLWSRHGAAPVTGNIFNFSVINEQVDAVGRLTGQKFRCNDALPGNPCAGGGSTVTGFRYDRLGQLRWTLRAPVTDSMQYDDAGNMVGRTDAVEYWRWHRFLVDGATNQLMSDSLLGGSAPVVRRFLYDSAGARVEEDTRATYWDPTQWYYVDASGRMTGQGYTVVGGGVQGVAGGASTCLYDAEGQVVFPCGDDGTVALAHDGANVVGFPGLANQPRATFVHGPGLDDMLLGIVRAGGSGAPDYREIVWVTDGSGRQFAVGTTGGLDPTTASLNTSTFPGWQFAGGTGNSFGFGASRQSDTLQNSTAVARLSAFRNRFYDQTTGRWLQEDPIGVAGGTNLYQFNGNNPVAYTDPFGLCPNPPCRSEDDPLKDRPLPPDVNPDEVTWNPDKGHYVHDKDGRIFRPHPEDAGHWDHWDIKTPGAKGQSRYPEKSVKPWPGQKRPPYGDQSATDPWKSQQAGPSLWDQFVESFGDVLHDIGKGVTQWPSPGPWALPPLPGFPMPAGVP